MRMMHFRLPLLVLLIVAVWLPVSCFAAPSKEAADAFSGQDGWMTFMLICNEGLNNHKGNAGNTHMVISMHPDKGCINLMIMAWDTFVDYKGYDVPQRLDMPFRTGGPEELLKVFNTYFGTDIRSYMSLNYLNLASLIDHFGGVEVDITRAERNALNDLVVSKKNQFQDQDESGFLGQAITELLTQECFLEEFGSQTHLNGLQAVGFGWLQYDSVYNCCQRDAKIIAALLRKVGAEVSRKVAFYTDESGEPADAEGKRLINLDQMTHEDLMYLCREMAPVLEHSYNNLSEEDITAIFTATAKVFCPAVSSDVNTLEEGLKSTILPMEVLQPYDTIAGSRGHRIDVEANKEMMYNFLYPKD